MAKILVIDDEEPMRLLLSKMLEREGHQVTLAGDGEEGLAAIRRSPAQLVIVDILMPRKDGIETIVALRQDHPGVKIMAISGGRRAIDPKFNLDSAHLLGVDDTLAKPFERRVLLDKVGRLLH